MIKEADSLSIIYEIAELLKSKDIMKLSIGIYYRDGKYENNIYHLKCNGTRK